MKTDLKITLALRLIVVLLMTAGLLAPFAGSSPVIAGGAAAPTIVSIDPGSGNRGIDVPVEIAGSGFYSEFGAVWTPRDPSRNWWSVAMSSDGARQTAVAYGGQIYTSVDYGATWTARDANREWHSVTMSSDGMYQTAVVHGGLIYTSGDYGANWTPRDSSRWWFSVAMSSDGARQTAVAYGGQIYTSVDYGATWTPRDASRQWYSVAMSSDGARQTAVVGSGQIYTSVDYGATWTPRDANREWYSVAMSSDGRYQTAVDVGGLIYTSVDYGATWTARDSNRQWLSVAMSSDGRYQTAVDFGVLGVNEGQIYTSYSPPPTVELARGGETITATGVVTEPPGKLTCTIPIPSDAEPGPWDVVVTNPDAQTATLPGGFNITYTITASAGPGGTITPSGTGTYTHGEPVDLTATPNAGCHFVNWTEEGVGVVSTSAAYSFTAAADRTLVANFALDTYTIAASAGAGGSITPSGTVTVNHGASRTFAVDPAQGYTVSDVVVDGASVGAVRAYTFSNVMADHTIHATFAEEVPPPPPPEDLSTWYLAEGSTDWGFDCYISIVNPNPEAVHAQLTYMTADGPLTGPSVAIPAMSQATVFPRETLGAADFSTMVTCTEGKTISVDRTMYWTGTGSAVPEAHCATGATSAETTWYLPEGSTDWGFETWLLLQNPGGSSTSCTVTWMIEGAEPQSEVFGIKAGSRLSVNMAEQVGSVDASIKVISDTPIVAERAMYRNDRREGHVSGGTPTAAPDYYLAEGCTGFGFTTYVLVQNPNDSETQVTVTYQATAGKVEGPSFTMPANSRKTICVNDTTPIPGDDPSFSTHVHGTQPIIVERAMYWNGGEDSAQVCHDSIGLAAPHASWYLADGQTSEGRETFTLVSNPNDIPVEVKVSYLPEGGGTTATFTQIILPSSRMTFNMADKLPSGRAAVLVESVMGGPVMCERAMYWNNRGTGTDTVGGYSD